MPNTPPRKPSAKRPAPGEATRPASREPSEATRLACLLVPALPLFAELRARPEWVGQPVAISDGPGPRAGILAVSPEATARGVRPGSTVVHARAACAGLLVAVVSPALEQAARDALLDAALSTSPRAEIAPPGTGIFSAEACIFLDARGVGALFPSERGFAGALQERAARLGLPGVVAVAGSRSVARIAARRLVQQAGHETNDAPLSVVPPGSDREWLAPLPLDLLAPDDALAESLGRFGLRRIGDLTKLPARALTTRLGPAIVPLLRLAEGAEREPPPPVPEETRFEEAQDLETPIQHLDPLLFVLRGLASRLIARLACRGLALGDLLLELGLEGGGQDARRVGLAAATEDARAALRLVALSLESKPLEAAVVHVRLATEGRAVRGDQLDFFRPPGPAPEALARTLAELLALCGPDRVGAPAVADDHRPDAYAVAPFQPVSARNDRAPVPTHVLAVRALRPPAPARVQLRGGRPGFVESGLARGAVLRCAGPWRTTGRWWSEEERFAFDHYDVQVEDGWVVRLRFDWRTKGWQIDGVYD